MKSRHLIIPVAALALIGWLSIPSKHDNAVLHPAPEISADSLPQPEIPAGNESVLQDSDFTKVLSAARHQIRELTAKESLLPANDGTRFFANNPAQNLTARFQDDGVLIRNTLDGNDLKITRHNSGSATLKVTGNRAEYLRPDGSAEWMENGENGFEHGMTLATRPHNAGADLRFLFSSGKLTASRDPESPSDLVFSDDSGTAIYGYRGIKAWDATGRDLPATMAPAEGGFEWIVDDRSATYPVTIDPLITNSQATFSSAGINTNFGGSVDINDDLAIVGDSEESTPSGDFAGAAYLFRRTSGTWALEQRLLSPDAQSFESFGKYVATDAGQVVVTAPGDSSFSPDRQGAVMLFQQVSGMWTRVNNFTTPGFSLFYVRSIDYKDPIIVVGTPISTYPGGSQGSIQYLIRSAGGWNSFFREYYLPSGTDTDSFGSSVATDGDRIAIGAPGRAQGAGQAFIVRPNPSINLVDPIATLSHSDPASGDDFGRSIAMEGDTVVVGAPEKLRGGLRDGAVYVFTGTGSNWSQTVKFAPTPSQTNTYFGNSVAIRNNILAASVRIADAFGGKIALFQRFGNTWIHRSSIPDAAPQPYAVVAMDNHSNLIAGFPSYFNPGRAIIHNLGNSSPGPELTVFTGTPSTLREIQSGATLPFGDAYLNEIQTWPVTLYNEGTTNLNITAASFQSGVSAGITVNGFTPLTLAPGQGGQITIRTQFATLGPASGTLRISSNDADENPFDIPVTFNVIRRPALPGFTITHTGSQVILRYPHTQFTTYLIRRSDNLVTPPSNWLIMGYMQTEYDFATSQNIKVFRDLAPPAGKAFYLLTID